MSQDATQAINENAISGLLHAGALGTFMRLPLMNPDRSVLSEVGINAAVLGFPWDSTCISRTGTNYGPKAIREASEQFTFFSASTEVNLRDHYRMADCGDVPVLPGNSERTMDRAQARITEILAAGALPVTLGGDHSVTIPCARAFAAHYDNPGLVLVDAHLDTAYDMDGDLLNHCCPITRAVDAGFDPKKIAIVAPSGWMNVKSELDYIRDHGITLYTIDDVIDQGAKTIAQKAAAVAGDGTDSVYLTIDIDSVDAAFAPGTGVPTPGGLTSREVLQIAAEVGKGGIGGIDLVEVSPAWDHDGITSRLACRIILDALQANAVKARQGK